MEEHKESMDITIQSTNDINESNEHSNGTSLINNDIVNSSNTTFGETVYCKAKDITNLPSEVLSIYEQYQAGLLAPVTKEQVSTLLQQWFLNEPISEFPTISHLVDPGLIPSDILKRRRLASDV